MISYFPLPFLFQFSNLLKYPKMEIAKNSFQIELFIFIFYHFDFLIQINQPHISIKQPEQSA